MPSRPTVERLKKPISVVEILLTVLLGACLVGSHSTYAQSSFSCSDIIVRPLENGSNDGLFGPSLVLEIINNNDQSSTLTRVHLQWPTILDYPGMHVSEFALNNIPHWQGMDGEDVNQTTNITDTAVDPSIPPGFFENTPEVDRSIAPFLSAKWTAAFSYTTTTLASYVNLESFSGTEFYFSNPSTPSTPCRIGLDLSPPPIPLVPVRSYFTTHTPTLTWSPVSWALAYQIEIDDDPAFQSPLRAEVASDMLDYTPNINLPNQIYYWHVRAKKNAVDWGRWSEKQMILVSAT